jgi:hypothetical protein
VPPPLLHRAGSWARRLRFFREHAFGVLEELKTEAHFVRTRFAFEEMSLKRRAIGRRKLAEQISFRGVAFDG